MKIRRKSKGEISKRDLICEVNDKVVARGKENLRQFNPVGFSKVLDKRTRLAGRGTRGIKLEEDEEDAIERGSFIKRDTTMTTKSEGGKAIGIEEC